MTSIPTSDGKRLLVAAALGIGISALIIWVPAHGHVRNATFGDGVLYRYVATHLNAHPGATGTLVSNDLPIRYGRIGLPLLLWLFSAGSRHAMFYVQPILMMAAGGAIAATTAALIQGPLIYSLAPFAALGLVVSIAGGFADAVALALSLSALLLVERRRWGLATVILAAAILTKEGALVVVAGIVVWHTMKREYKGLVVIGAIVPFLVWGIFVARRFGVFPLNDPWWRKTFGTPFVALWATLSRGGAAAVIAGVHAGLALSALAIWRRTLAATIALLASFQVLVIAPVVWSYLGDGLRAVAFLEVFLIIALLLQFSQKAPYSDGSETSPLR